MFRVGLASFAKLFADAYAAKNVRMNNILPATGDHKARIQMGRYGKAQGVSALAASV
ncbi:MAG: hypothetical protein AAFR10_02875 [Pseudomonadota bacterium]